MKLGINTNNDCGKDCIEILNNIKKAGFDSVMVAFNLKDDELMLQEAKRLNLDVPYVHLEYKFGNNLWVKGRTANAYVEKVINQINLCAKYGIKEVVFHCAWGSSNDVPLKPNKEGLKNFNKILDVCKNSGISVAIENLDRYSIGHVFYVLKHTKSENVGFCYDIGHHNIYYPKIDLLRKFGKRLIAVHLHDNNCDWEYGYDYGKDIHFLPFDGKINYDKILKKIAKTNYNNVVMLEVRKRAFGEDGRYGAMTDLEFLVEAKRRAEKINNIIENLRKNS
jgi:sugar phosphate isomerase/epimerase